MLCFHDLVDFDQILIDFNHCLKEFRHSGETGGSGGGLFSGRQRLHWKLGKNVCWSLRLVIAWSKLGAKSPMRRICCC